MNNQRGPGSRIPMRTDATDRTTGRLGIGLSGVGGGGMRPPSGVGSRLPTAASRPSGASNFSRPSGILSRASGIGGVNRPSNVHGGGQRPSTDWSYQSGASYGGDTMRLQGIGSSSVKPKSVWSSMSTRKATENRPSLAARKSLLPGSMTPAQRLFSATPQSKRPSLNPGSAQSSARRQSLIGDRKHLKDCRPLDTLDYRTKVMEKLITLMDEHKFPLKVPQRFHVSPTGSDIAAVFNFLFGFFDQKVKIERSNMDREVPGRLKMYGYPHTITRSVLTACTTPHAIGQLFGAYEYLIDCINYLTKVTPQQAPPSQQQAGQDQDSKLSESLLSTAIALLRGEITKNDVQENLEQYAIEKYGSESQHMQMINDLDRISSENEKLQEEIEKIESLPQAIAEYETDLANLDKWLTDLERQQKSLNEALTAKKEQVEERQNQKRALERELAEMEKAVKAQEFGPEEADMAKQHQKQLEEEIISEQRQIDEMKRNIRVAKLEVKKFEDNLSKMASELESFINAIRDSVNSRCIQDHVKPLVKFINDEEWERLLGELVSAKQKDKQTIELLARKVGELKLKITEQITSLQGSVLVEEKQRLAEIEARMEDCKKAIKEEEENCERIKSENEKLKSKNTKELEELQTEFECNRRLLAEADARMAQSEDQMRDRNKALRKEVAEREAEYNRLGEELLAKARSRREARNESHSKDQAVLKDILETIKARNEVKREIIAQNKIVEQRLKQMTKPRVKKENTE